MNRRHFLKALLSGLLAAGFGPAPVAAKIARPPSVAWGGYDDGHIKDYLVKMQNFDSPHAEDIFLGNRDLLLLKSSVRRFRRLQRTVGHGNFQLISFDEAIKTAAGYARVGAFTGGELGFLEKIFYQDPAAYGFLGEKPLKNLTDRIRKNRVVKIPSTGNYIYKGLPLETYKKIRREVGDSVILTSGVRSIIKQFLLFLNKAYLNRGNLSLASRSLAPPGCSFHGISDFDVGQIGFGAANFTERFVTTDVFFKLQHLGYLGFRYPKNNFLGVRFEPWHIKVGSNS